MTRHRLTDLQARLDRAAADIDHLRALLPAAWQQLVAAQPGVRSVPTDTTGGTHGGDPTAAGAAARRADPAVRALDDLADWIIGTEQRTVRARTVADIWAHPPSAKGSGAGDPGCQWMRQHNGPWEEARYHVTVTGRAAPGGQPATVGRLATGRVLHVGQRTYRHVRDHGELPGADVVTAWAQGRRPKRRLQPGAGNA